MNSTSSTEATPWLNVVLEENLQFLLCGMKEDGLPLLIVVDEGSSPYQGPCEGMMCCALWDGNGPHNQLGHIITAALWVPLQSHPQKKTGLARDLVRPAEETTSQIILFIYFTFQPILVI